MGRPLRIKEVMGWIALVALEMGAVRLLREGPARDPLTTYLGMLSTFLLFILTPFLVMAAWERLAGRGD